MNMMIPTGWQTQVIVAPQLTLIAILFVSIFSSKHWGLLYGLCYGMLHDIVYYGHMLGAYSLAMGFACYIVNLSSYRFKGHIAMNLLLILVGNVIFEVMIYAIYRTFQITHLDIKTVILHQTLPSMLVNLLFALLIYVPMLKMLENRNKTRKQVEEDLYIS